MLEFNNINLLEEELAKKKNITKILSIVRGLFATLTLVFLLCLLSLKEYILYGLLSASFFALFILSVILSNPTFKRVSILENKKKVYLRHKQRREKNFSHFNDNGSDFMDKEDYKLSDLDIFGPKSLYQYLSEAKTPLGRSILAKQLKKGEDLGKEFKEMTYYFASSEETLELEASLMEFKKGQDLMKSNEFESLVKEPIKLDLLSLLPIVSFLGMIIYAILAITLKINPYIILVFLFLNLALSKFLIKNPILTKDASSYYYLSDLYVDLADSIYKTNIENDYYKKLKEEINSEVKVLKKIRGIYSLLNVRRNLLLNIILNLVCSFDSFLLLILKQKIKNGITLSNSLKDIAIIELALSFKNIGMDNDVYCLGQDSLKLEANGMHHPFVKNCVENSITLDGGIVLTGSNMSGKTTFMRTLGICLILHNASGLVPARSFFSPKINIFTSLRAHDMLQEGVSTFYAEIKRMKKINMAIKEEKCLILVDEIFKGTNAMERIYASNEVINKLNLYKQYFIISTHDFELCDAKNILNYHFEETYIDDKISFDYKLKEGRGIKGNALYLLKMSGIIEN